MMKDTLKERLKAALPCRANGIKALSGDIIVCALPDKAEAACREIAAARPDLNIKAVCLPSENGREKLKNLRNSGIGIIEKRDLATDSGIVVYWQKCVAPDVLYFLDISRNANVAIFPALAPGMAGCRQVAGFYDRHAQKLENIFASLGDAESREAFASVVKAIITGDISYVKQCRYGEYECPETLPEKGDIIIDAGLFDSVVLRKFALAAPDGAVYGFEPEPHNLQFVKETLKKYGDPGNIHLVNKGLYSRKGSMFISDQGSSGSLSNNSARGAECAVVDLDSFAREEEIARIDLIKMDIEGAELQALAGARETIRRDLPKLHICAYHHTDDLVAIPELLEEIAPMAYDLFFAAHVPYMNEYVYYARPRKKTGGA